MKAVSKHVDPTTFQPYSSLANFFSGDRQRIKCDINQTSIRHSKENTIKYNVIFTPTTTT